MIRKIIVPTSNSHLFHFPDSFIGKKVEVIAFSFEECIDISQPDENISAFYHTTKLDLSNLKNDADEV